MARMVSLFPHCAFNEPDEARFVVNRIKTWQDNGGALAECAISTAATPSRVCWKKHCYRQVCRTVLLTADADLSTPRNQRCALVSAPDC